METLIKTKLADEIADVVEAAFSDEAIERIKKHVNEIVCEIQDDVEWRLKSDVAANLGGHVSQAVERTIEAIIKGNEAEMRRYLSCDPHWNGRSHQHTVIHGKLFEATPLELRRLMAEAHPELIRNERIADLEKLVEDLTAQVNKLDADNKHLYDRLRG